MTTASTSTQYPASNPSCRLLPGDSSQVQPKAPLLHILHMAGAQEDTFTLKEVMHYLGQYIMVKQLYDKQRQHLVHCQDDPLGELLEVESFSVKNPSPVYEMLKKNLIVLNCTDAAKTLSVAKDSNHVTSSEDPGQTSSHPCKLSQALAAEGMSTSTTQPTSHRRQRETDGDSLDDLPRSACKRPKLDVSLEEWDLSGLPWWFLGNLRSNYGRKSNGSTDIHTNQDEDTAIVSDTTDDLWFLNEAESEQVSVEMKEAALERGSDGEEEEEKKEWDKEDKEMQDDLDEDSQCLSDDTDTEISTQDAWQCTECRKYNSPMQRYCVRCWALQKDWYKDCPRLVHSISVPDIPTSMGAQEDGEDDGIDIPDCPRTVSDPVILPSHSLERQRPTDKGKGRLPRDLNPRCSVYGPTGISEGLESSEGDSQDMLDMAQTMGDKQEAILEPCKLCRIRPRNGNIIHGRTGHLIACFSCARKLHKFHAPCPGCGQVIQNVIKTFIA
ncbi:protein Mdm4 isoform X2 [Lepisosteus oculatus]|uniref:protein Mdm4 isoform X2 n=1 Tax=Lepisosteus oculatus TaxID=7918 RepID=UPI0003EAB80F|nr:PREDICTED: protein Mdm4 isoform X2 [Lepisosteus oculatus]